MPERVLAAIESNRFVPTAALVPRMHSTLAAALFRDGSGLALGSGFLVITPKPLIHRF